MPKAVIFIGLQASGKSTFYQHYFSSEFIHINLDTLHTRNKEKQLLQKCLEENTSFVVDNTNPTKLERAFYIELAQKYHFFIEGYFFQSVLSSCIQRNQLRSGKACIPRKAIAATSNKLQLPSYEEGFDQLYFVQITSSAMDSLPFQVELWKCSD